MTLTGPLGEQRQLLAPLMGFPEEQYVISGKYADFYTCVVNGWRVFVWNVVETWAVQISSFPHITADLETQFFETEGDIQSVPEGDIVALQCIIHDLTSEGNPYARPANPTGATESDPSLSQATCSAPVG